MAKKIEVSAVGVKQIGKLTEKLAQIQTKVGELAAQLGNEKLLKAVTRENAAAEALYAKMSAVLESDAQ
jgi:hypothetical protein